MKLAKSLLLGTVAGLAASVGAQAADLPSKKAAPVEYVRVCSAFGAGFFYIPGTDTCLRVAGRVRAEMLYGQPYWGGDDVIGYRSRAIVRLDARNQTAYGTLRTFISVQFTNSSGTYGRGVNNTGPNFVPGTTATGVNGGAAAALSSTLPAAFVQFGPLTAGRAQSFFDFYADALNYGPIRGSDMVTNLFAYTATFGGGFSATLSLEDNNERQAYTAGFSGGVTMPDVVANLNLTQGWGRAQLSGVVHQVTSPSFRTATGGRVGDEYGYAIQGGVKLNLPMLAAGDVLWLQGAYAKGAISYLGYGGNGIDSTWGSRSRVGVIDVANTDRVVGGPLGISSKLTTGWDVTAGLLHYWTPTVRQAVYGSYSALNYGNFFGAFSSAPVAGTVNTFVSGATVNSKEIRVGSNLIWSPVAGLDIGVEVLYARVDPKGRQFSSKFASLGGAQVAANAAFAKGSDDAWQGRLRVQRDF